MFILNTTTDTNTVNAYLWALWIGDLGHVGFTLYLMGLSEITDVGSWSATIWGNIGATLFLFVSRSLYFLGVFDDKPKTTPGRELRPRKLKSKAR